MATVGVVVGANESASPDVIRVGIQFGAIIGLGLPEHVQVQVLVMVQLVLVLVVLE